MTRIAILLSVLVWSAAASACMVAHQVRRIPIGATNGTLHLLEVDVVRTGDIDAKPNVWFLMTPRLVDVHANGARAVLKTWPETKVFGEQAQTHLRAVFADAKRIVKDTPGFEPAELLARQECAFMQACAPFKSSKDGLRQTNGTTHRAPVPEMLIKYADLAADAPLAGAGIDVVDTLRIGSQRYYSVTVGWGHDQNPCDVLAPPCTDTRKARAGAVLGTDVIANLVHRHGLHHGKEWDVIVPAARQGQRHPTVAE